MLINVRSFIMWINGIFLVEKFILYRFRIARNAVTDHYRRRRPPDALPDDLSEDAKESGSPELAEWLTCAVATLPDGYRRAIELTELEELPHKEAAQRLGISLTAVKSRVRRGRESLKGLLLRCCHVELDVVGRVVDYRVRSRCCDSC